MSKTEKRQTLEACLSVDHDRLHGPLEEAVKYLQEVLDQNPDKKLNLEEVWTGYEDMHLEFQYRRLETDAELEQRLSRERRQRREEAVKKGRDKQRKEIDDHINKLIKRRSKLG